LAAPEFFRYLEDKGKLHPIQKYLLGSVSQVDQLDFSQLKEEIIDFLYKVALNKESAFVNDLFNNSSFSKRISQDLRNQNIFASGLLSASVDKLKDLPLDATIAVVKNFKETGDSSCLIAALISKFASKVSYIIDKEHCLNELLTSIMSITSMGTRELSLVCILECIIRINKSLSEGHLDAI
jgi:hypothetical protein